MNIVDRLRRHIAHMAPHQKTREQGVLLTESLGEIERLQSAITKTLDQNAHLADGDNCTLQVLKQAMPQWELEDEYL